MRPLPHASGPSSRVRPRDGSGEVSTSRVVSPCLAAASFSSSLAPSVCLLGLTPAPHALHAYIEHALPIYEQIGSA